MVSINVGCETAPKYTLAIKAAMNVNVDHETTPKYMPNAQEAEVSINVGCETSTLTECPTQMAWLSVSALCPLYGDTISLCSQSSVVMCPHVL